MESEEKFIIISIKNYRHIDDNIKLINLIDNQIINTNENIFGTDIQIFWDRSQNNQYDYKCEILGFNIKSNSDLINEHIKNKFYFVQNFIKFNYDIFGTNWSIEYVIE